MEKHLIKLGEIVKFFKDEEKLLSRGENALESGHVASMTFDGELKIVRGKIDASMKDKQYNVEIFLDSDWSITTMTCSCPRGQFICHHMACLALYARDNVSVTDQACSWSTIKPKKESGVKKISNIYPRKDHRATERDLNDIEISDFKNKLQIFEGAIGYSWLLSEVCDGVDENNIVDVEHILFSTAYNETANKVLYLEETLRVTPEIIAKVAEDTVGQAHNSKWLIARKNRLTASNFGAVLSACQRNRYSPSLFKRISATYNLDQIKAIQWGREHEDCGIAELESSLNVKVTRTGLWLHECGFLGASPDGFVGDKETVEVKCPFKYRDTSMLESIKCNHDYIIIADKFGNVSVNKKHEYYQQIQGQLFITKRKLCHLVVWTPKETAIVTVEYEDFLEQFETLKTFYLHHYVKFLLGEKYSI